MLCRFTTAAFVGAVIVGFFAPDSASAQSASALMDEIRQELPPELTEPEVRTVTGTFSAPLQSVYGTGQVPNPKGSLAGNINIDPPIKIGGIARACKILGGCFDIDVENSEPGIDIDIISYFGIEIEADLAADAEIGYELVLFDPQAPGTGIKFGAEIPLEVDIKFPAYNTLAPEQEFYVDSSWGIDENRMAGRRFTFNTTEPDYINVDTTLLFDLNFDFRTTVCVFGCINIEINITLPQINWNLFNFNFLPFEFCAFFEKTALGDSIPLEGFCPIDIDLDPCAPFVAAGLECPYISLANDPYNHYPIPGLEAVAPGAATIDVLKALEDGELFFATNAFTTLTPRNFISSEFDYAVAGMTLDFANAAAGLVQLPPLNGSLGDLFSWKGTNLNPVASALADRFSYNIFDASLGFDFVLGHEFELKPRAPKIRLQYNDPGGQWSIDETFRAGERKLIQMPADLDPGDLVITVEGRDPRFSTQIAGLVDPRFELSAIGASIEVPGVGEVELNPLFQSGDLLPSPDPFAEISFDAQVSGLFPAPPVYDLAPRTDPWIVTGTVLNQPDGTTGRPRLVTNCDTLCEPIDLAIIDLRNSGQNGEILIVPAGLMMRNTQVLGGRFDLMIKGGSTQLKNDQGENVGSPIPGTYMVFGGSTLMPGLDGAMINLAVADSSNQPPTGQGCDEAGQELQGGLEFATNEGAFIRNSVINAGRFPDGTMYLVDDASSEAEYDVYGPGFVQPCTTIKGRVAVFSGSNNNTATGPQLIDLFVSSSQILAGELLISNSITKPTIVTLDDSTLHADLDLRSSKTELRISGNSLVVGDDDATTDNNNRGLIEVRGSQEDVSGGGQTMFGMPVATGLLDTGAKLSNYDRIAIGPGGGVSVRSGNVLANTGSIELEGSYDDLGSMQAMATVSALTPGYSADDLFNAVVANPTNDALLLIDGGTVEDQTITSAGATILGRAGSLATSSIDSEDTRLIVDNGDFGFVESNLFGYGDVHIRSGSTLSLTAGDLVDGSVEPLFRGAGQQISDDIMNPVYVRRALSVVNDGTLQIVPGASPSSQAVQMRGDAERNGELLFTNNGDIHVTMLQSLQFSGDAAIQNRGTIEIDALAEVVMLDQQYPTVDEGGNPIIGVITPTFTLYEGSQTIVNGELSFDQATEFQMDMAGGVLEGTGDVLAALTNIGGTVAPGNAGNPTGTLTIDQNYVQLMGGKLEIQINAGGNSYLAVDDPVVLGGELVVVLNTTPNLGDTFEVMSYSSLDAGEFDNVRILTPAGDEITDFTFDITYNPNGTVTIMYAEVTEDIVAQGIYGELGRFQDTSSDTFAFDFIEIFAANGITGGCGNGNFCPEGTVTRAQMAVFLERGMRGSDFSPPPATGTVFTDVAAGDFAAGFIEQLFADGITGGCGGGNYCPNDAVTRAQMAVFLLRAKYGPSYSPPPATGVFNDVPVGSFAADWIEALAAEGITSGCGGGNYCPNDPVTRAQMAVFMVRTFDLTIDSTLIWDQGNWDEDVWQ